jgi:protein pelota
MKLGIRVKEIKFHEFSDRLRIHGIIEEGPQDLGSFHTLNVTADSMDKINIIKENWKNHQLKRLDEAVNLRCQPILFFISLDEDEATIAILRQSGIQLLANISSKRSGKMYESSDNEKEYFNQIINIIKNQKNSDSPIVVVGSGFTREHLLKYGKENAPKIFENAHTNSTGNAGMNGINEAIKSGLIKTIIKENRVVHETTLIEKLFEEIKKDGLATYGESEVKIALQNGAVERLLISDVLIRSKKGEELLNIAKQNNSEFTIINTMHESGKKFEGLGGVAALLRFKI